MMSIMTRNSWLDRVVISMDLNWAVGFLCIEANFYQNSQPDTLFKLILD